MTAGQVTAIILGAPALIAAVTALITALRAHGRISQHISSPGHATDAQAPPAPRA